MSGKSEDPDSPVREKSAHHSTEYRALQARLPSIILISAGKRREKSRTHSPRLNPFDELPPADTPEFRFAKRTQSAAET